MPFGLKNVGATYQWLVNEVFKDQLGRNVGEYVDDMLVKSKKVEHHLADLRRVFGTLRKYNTLMGGPLVGFDINGEFKAEWLPEGFEESVTKSRQGLVVRKWAPQLEILSHKSKSVFLSHCGWNSVLESLSQGVPIIGWPLVAEQAYNSKLMEEEIGVCVELARGLDGRVMSGEVEREIKLVMGGGENGKEMKMKASEAARKVRAAVEKGDQLGSSIKALDGFLEIALS
ncbi:PREDICTED: UDP-glycosyltransferase 92A1-like [Nelumbo nucifera]|uniref:UDP-glycosyltransferase 92A1-like n=1 Tax=Nelumbo nucifera TaxID=4432 RepID=A0A1U7ZVE4_NELNU|nr:PREDICTED: UDP-glycosyltransferase 92A1-like [Nelumbo nucifera]